MLFTDAQAAFLDEVHYAVLATLNADGSIQQTVVWYLRAGEAIWISMGAASIKARNLGRNANATLTIEDGVRYLTLSGTGTLHPPDDTLRARLATRYLGPERATAWLGQRSDAARVLTQLTPNRIYGQGIDPPQKRNA